MEQKVIDKNCRVCGQSYYQYIPKLGSHYCSYKCYELWIKQNKTPNCKCVICGKEFYRKTSYVTSKKYGVTCSKECAHKYKSIYFSGEGNHQYGLIGSKNASFKGNYRQTVYGYITEICPNHPYPHDKYLQETRVLQHRLVVERNHWMFDAKYFETKNNMVVLKPIYVVHHKNGIKTDNRIENLEIMKRGEHTTLHNLNNTIVRDNQGRFKKIIKTY